MSNLDFLNLPLESTTVELLPKLVVIVGPSGVGKSGVSLELAREFSGEIVNGDATSMYRYLDIGSAKPTLPERRRIPHHLIDIVSPDEIITVAQYQQLTYKSIDDIFSRNKQPFLVGGSGLYVRSIIEGYRIPPAPPDHHMRKSLEGEAEKRGYVWLHELLCSLDPLAAANIAPTNIRRVIRAIEVCKTTGQPISLFWKQRKARYKSVIIGLTQPIEELFERINLRVDHMLQEGLVDEVKSILDMGYNPDSPALLSIGYKEIIQYLQGYVTLDSAIHKIKQATRRLARRQMSGWFRQDDTNINWFDISNPHAISHIKNYLMSNGFKKHDEIL